LVLNIISFLALFNVIGYMVMGNFNSVIFFIILAVLVRNFSHNMIIVLGTPLVIVNLFSMRNGLMEGFKDGETASTSATDNTKDDKKNVDDKKMDDKKNVDDKKMDDKKKPSDSQMMSGDNSGVVSAAAVKKDSFEVGRSKNGGSKIDYASTIEDAYDDLNKILGSDGIKRLTSDTQGLMKQQMQLAESMEGMKPIVAGMLPLIDQMKGMMSTMDGNGNGEGGLGSIMEMANKLTKSLGNTQ
jgi:hypothetical protein